MASNLEKIYKKVLQQKLTKEQRIVVEKEYALCKQNKNNLQQKSEPTTTGLYDYNDLYTFQQLKIPSEVYNIALKSLEELIEHDQQREKDGFPRKIRIGKLIRPGKGNKAKVVIVPTTTESKFYHDNSVTEEENNTTGGSGEGEEGEVIGEQQAQPEPGEGEGQGAGEGEGASHDVSSKAFDLGKILTEKFKLPNIKDKGKKRSMTKFVYDLTDRNRGFGQVLDKKATLRRIVKTNIQLGNINGAEPFDPENLLLNPQDEVYRILSKEKDFDNQAIVFFVRDYSGSMQGDPTEAVSTQHLLIYSWLMYQYQNNVETRFILHDTDAKEVKDFYTYYSSMVAGGTRVAPAFKLVNKIIEEEQLAKDYNIYVFYGTDGDDWDSDGKELTQELKKTLLSANRLGITVAKNSWTSDDKKTTVETTVEKSGLLKEKPDLIKIDSFAATNVSEERLIEGIKKIIGT